MGYTWRQRQFLAGMLLNECITFSVAAINSFGNDGAGKWNKQGKKS